jgi:hypothetical protein
MKFSSVGKDAERRMVLPGAVYWSTVALGLSVAGRAIDRMGVRIMNRVSLLRLVSGATIVVLGACVFISPASAADAPKVTATPSVAALSFSPHTGLTFSGAQPVQTLSSPRSLTIKDTGPRPLEISRLSFAGTDLRDFVVSSDGCLGRITAGASCKLGISFAPHSAGARSATLRIAADDPAGTASVPLSGTAKWAAQFPTLYWANSGTNTIGEATQNATVVNQSFITGASSPLGDAVDGRHIYWANAGTNTIAEANLNGTGVNQSFITGASSPFGVAVDDQHIYWANDKNGTIGRAGLSGIGVNQSFITGVGEPQAVRVDGQHIYWANLGSNTIGRANLDGTHVNKTFITGANEPEDVAVDGQHLYWANDGSNTIGRANLDGTHVNQSFITGANQPQAVAVDGQHIYWANDGSNTIGEANLDGSGPNQSFITGADTPAGVAVSVPVAQLTPASPPAFPATPQGGVSRPLTLKVSNIGQRALQLTGLTFTGADPSDFAITANGCVGGVAPAASCQLTVRFSPRGGGARTASLQIATNDYANSPLHVTLKGTGERAASTPLLSLSKASITYGSEQLERFSAAVSSHAPGTPTGKVAVRAGTLTLCTITLTSGKGSCSASSKALPAGRHTITAVYAGDINYLSSTSPSKTLTVTP